MEATVEVAPTQFAPEPTLPEVLGIRPREAEHPRDARGYVLRRILLAADIVALFCAFAVAELAAGFQGTGPRSLEHSLLMLGIGIPGWILLARAHNLYHVESRRTEHSAAEELAPIMWMTTLWAWAILLVSSLTGIRSVNVPKLVVFWAATVCFLILLRSIARAWSRRRPWYRQDAIVVGTLEEAAAVVPKILRHPEYGMRVVACVELPGGKRGVRPGTAVGSVPVVQGEVDLVEMLGEVAVDRVILGPSVHRLPNFREVLSELRELRLQVDMVPSWYDVVGSRVDLHELEGMPLVGIPDSRLAPSSLACKRALDVIVSGVALFCLLPVLVACAVAIKRDSPGPVLFRQRRVGRGGRSFELVKFRSMQENADALKDNLAELNFHGGGTQTGMFKINGDPRITRVGRVLRRYSLDELPQLINVVRGDMSLVGPRPLIENEAYQVAGRHRRRVMLTPGLTGLWQVNGRSDIPFEGMIDLDYLYVTNWSLWGDIKLLMRTFAAVARGTGAF